MTQSSGSTSIEVAGIVARELAALGMRDVCLAPGSRSAPLAIALHQLESIRLHVHVDERAGAFFALGLARATGRPVALLCTSGSAPAHFGPALIEADASGIPLVALTADRPARLQGCGAPQATRQPGLFDNHVRWQGHLEAAAAGEGDGGWIRATVGAAWEAALRPDPGPVHLNVAFDEPLVPRRLAPLDEAPADAHTRFLSGAPRTRLDAAEADVLRQSLSTPRGVVVAGPRTDAPQAVADFARAWNVPVFADPLSGLRAPQAPDVQLITTYDAFLRSHVVADRLRPDWVLRTGDLPTSKFLVRWLGKHTHTQQVVVDSRRRHVDPERRGGVFVRASAHALGSLAPPRDVQSGDPSWTDTVGGIEAACRACLRDHLCADHPSPEGLLIEALLDAAPDGASIFAGSSMPVRDLDTFMAPDDRRLHLVANRGVNGIDGLVSTALGWAAGSSGPTYALLGDLGFLHDLGGLLAAKQVGAGGLVLVVINNDGGGIFDYLPNARLDGVHEPLFVRPHGLRFEHAASLFGLAYQAPAPAEWRSALRPPEAGEVRLVEVSVDRAQSRRAHGVLMESIMAAAEHASQ